MRRRLALVDASVGNEESAVREIVTNIFGLAFARQYMPLCAAGARSPGAKKSDEGVSLVTFGGFCILRVIGVVHGVYEHDNSSSSALAPVF